MFSCVQMVSHDVSLFYLVLSGGTAVKDLAPSSSFSLIRSIHLHTGKICPTTDHLLQAEQSLVSQPAS